MTNGDLQAPSRGERLRLDDELVAVEGATVTDSGIDLIIRHSDGRLGDRSVTVAQLAAARVPENDARGVSRSALAGLWGRWDRGLRWSTGGWPCVLQVIIAVELAGQLHGDPDVLAQHRGQGTAAPSGSGTSVALGIGHPAASATRVRVTPA
jgi:hypothetical protein